MQYTGFPEEGRVEEPKATGCARELENIEENASHPYACMGKGTAGKRVTVRNKKNH